MKPGQLDISKLLSLAGFQPSYCPLTALSCWFSALLLPLQRAAARQCLDPKTSFLTFVLHLSCEALPDGIYIIVCF